MSRHDTLFKHGKVGTMSPPPFFSGFMEGIALKMHSSSFNFGDKLKELKVNSIMQLQNFFNVQLLTAVSRLHCFKTEMQNVKLNKSCATQSVACSPLFMTI